MPILVLAIVFMGLFSDATIDAVFGIAAALVTVLVFEVAFLVVKTSGFLIFAAIVFIVIQPTMPLLGITQAVAIFDVCCRP